MTLSQDDVITSYTKPNKVYEDPITKGIIFLSNLKIAKNLNMLKQQQYNIMHILTVMQEDVDEAVFEKMEKKKQRKQQLLNLKSQELSSEQQQSSEQQAKAANNDEEEALQLPTSINNNTINYSDLGFTRTVVSIRDESESDMVQHFPTIFKAINDALSQGQNILVHW